MLRYRLRTLLIVLAIGPPLIAGLVLMSPIDRRALLDLIMIAAFFAALACLWIYWPTLTKWI
jgi:hypothetical protein